MKWGTPPKGTVAERAHVVGHGEGTSLQHKAFGSKVEGAAAISNINPNYDIATKWSTAPYRGDDDVKEKPSANVFGYRDRSRQNKCMANGDTCNGWATEASGKKWCAGHAKSGEGTE